MAVSINVDGATFRLLGQPGRHSVEQDLSVIETLYEALLICMDTTVEIRRYNQVLIRSSMEHLL